MLIEADLLPTTIETNLFAANAPTSTSIPALSCSTATTATTTASTITPSPNPWQGSSAHAFLANQQRRRSSLGLTALFDRHVPECLSNSYANPLGDGGGGGSNPDSMLSALATTANTALSAVGRRPSQSWLQNEFAKLESVSTHYSNSNAAAAGSSSPIRPPAQEVPTYADNVVSADHEDDDSHPHHHLFGSGGDNNQRGGVNVMFGGGGGGDDLMLKKHASSSGGGSSLHGRQADLSSSLVVEIKPWRGRVQLCATSSSSPPSPSSAPTSSPAAAPAASGIPLSATLLYQTQDDVDEDVYEYPSVDSSATSSGRSSFSGASSSGYDSPAALAAEQLAAAAIAVARHGAGSSGSTSSVGKVTATTRSGRVSKKRLRDLDDEGGAGAGGGGRGGSKPTSAASRKSKSGKSKRTTTAATTTTSASSTSSASTRVLASSSSSPSISSYPRPFSTMGVTAMPGAGAMMVTTVRTPSSALGVKRPRHKPPNSKAVKEAMPKPPPRGQKNEAREAVLHGLEPEEARLEKNRQSAKECRLRKKEYVVNLEIKLAEFEKREEARVAELDAMKSEVAQLRRLLAAK